MINPAELIDQMTTGEKSVDQILNEHLYPGKALYDVDVRKLPIQVMDSGFHTLDHEYMLLKEDEGELIIVGGRPSMGKSALMFQLALYVSQSRPVHVFSLEMSQESIVRRLIATHINRPIAAIQRGHVDEETLEKAKEQLKNYKYHIDDRSGLTIHMVCDAARSRAKKESPALVVIDYLQLLRGDKGHSRDTEIGEITKELKSLAKDLRCPVIVGSQLNRQCEIRGRETGNYRPILSDLRESGSIEQDADIILAVHREFRYTQLRPDEADILVLKNRNGMVGDMILKFYAAQTQFVDEGNQEI